MSFLNGNCALLGTFEFPEGSLDDVMMNALLMERVQFIEVLLMNGFNMSTFLTVSKLRQLYNEAVTS